MTVEMMTPAGRAVVEAEQVLDSARRVRRLEILERVRAGGLSRRSLAAEYGISHQAILKMLRREEAATTF